MLSDEHHFNKQDSCILLFFIESLSACQFSKFSKVVNSYNICASINKSSINYSLSLSVK